MKVSILAAAALLAGIASTQSLAGLPACAYSCVEGGYPASCNLDTKCICTSQQFLSAVTCCVSKACNASDQAATIKYANGICGSAGVTNLPQSATCASATGNSTGAAASTASGSAASSASSAAASSGSETTVAAGSSAASTQSAATTASTSNAAAFIEQGVGILGVFVIGAAALL